MNRQSFAARYGPWALVAGGSQGLGAAFAAEIARRGVNLALVARRPGPLADTAAGLRAQWGVQVQTITADLAADGAADLLADELHGRSVGLVVANAALSPAGLFTALDAGRLSQTIDLNCAATALLAHRFLPAMIGRGSGGLVLVSSLAGGQGVPGLAVYSATKAFVICLGEALWAETRGSGVDVLVSSPGAVTTPGYRETATRPAPGTLTPADVAASTIAALGRGPRVIPGGLNKINAMMLSRLLPRRAAIAIFGRATAAALGEGPQG